MSDPYYYLTKKDTRCVPANYFLVEKGSPLFESIAAHIEVSKSFVAHTENIVKKYQAASAILNTGYPNWQEDVIYGLCFDLENTPSGWERNMLGGLRPKQGALEEKDFEPVLPHYAVPFRPYKKEYAAMHYASVGGEIIVALPSRDDALKEIPDAKLLNDAALAALKDAATENEKKSIERLASIWWLPAPIYETDVFTAPEDVKKLSSERAAVWGSYASVWVELKHSALGIRLARPLARARRALRNHGL